LKVLDGLCRKILEARANAVFYIGDADLENYQTAAVSYFLQIADFIGLPVIMWTAHMTGLPSVSDLCPIHTAGRTRHRQDCFVGSGLTV